MIEAIIFLIQVARWKIFIISFSFLLVALFDALAIVCLIPLLVVMVGGPLNNESIASIPFLEGIHISIDDWYFLVIFIIFKSFFSFFAGIMVISLKADVAFNIRQSLYNIMMAPTENEAEAADVGSKMALLTYHVDTLIRGLHSFSALTSTGASLIVYIGFLCAGVGLASFWYFGVALLIFGLLHSISKKIKWHSHILAERQNVFAEMSLSLVRCTLYLLGTGQINFAKDEFQRGSNAIRQTVRDLGRLTAFVGSLKDLLVIFAIAVFYWGSQLHSDFEINVFLASLLLLYRTASTIITGQSVFTAFLEVTGSIIQIKSELSSSTTNRSFIPKAEIAPATFNTPVVVECVDLDFHFSRYKDPIIRSCAFSLSEGEIVGIYAPSGSGKSTLLKLLVGLLVPTGGAIRIFGKHSHMLDASERKELFGFVTQDAPILLGSVEFNLTTSRALPSELDAQRATEILRLVELTNDFPDLHFQIKENGSNISGGQRQRLCLAREMLRKPKIMIIDEGLSGMGADMRHRLLNRLRSYLPDTVVVLVSHAETDMALCDKCLRLEDLRR